MLKRDTMYAFINTSGRFAIPVEHLHILEHCANIEYDWTKESGRQWKLGKSEMELSIIEPSLITALIIEDKMKGASS